MKHCTKDLAGAALDWAVAKAEGLLDADIMVGEAPCKAAVLAGPHGPVDMRSGAYFRPSTDWAQAGPIIERERIGLDQPVASKPYWTTFRHPKVDGDRAARAHGTTPLIAAMRCYVASKLGDEIEIPKELQ